MEGEEREVGEATPLLATMGHKEYTIGQVRGYHFIIIIENQLDHTLPS